MSQTQISREEILKLYTDTVQLLAGLYREYSESRAAELRVRADVYASSDATSPSGKDTEARHATATYAIGTVTLEGEIRVHELYLRMYDKLLDQMAVRDA